jgi:predicted nucleic acid-binding Zn ribbon protein
MAGSMTGGECRACGHSVRPGSRFCHTCGASMGARQRLSRGMFAGGVLIGILLVSAVVHHYQASQAMEWPVAGPETRSPAPR